MGLEQVMKLAGAAAVAGSILLGSGSVQAQTLSLPGYGTLKLSSCAYKGVRYRPSEATTANVKLSFYDCPNDGTVMTRSIIGRIYGVAIDKNRDGRAEYGFEAVQKDHFVIISPTQRDRPVPKWIVYDINQ